MSRAYLLLGGLFLSLPTIAYTDFSGPVVGVSDGDTIKVMHNGTAEKIRLNGIDCPEKGQAFGQKAKQFTSALAFGKEVTIQDHGLDKRKYSKDESLGALEAAARTSKRGLWADPESVPPWEWRKQRNLR